MITVDNLALQYGKRVLFNEVNIRFNHGNCYGVIGANGAGKSTFLKILSGEISPNGGHVAIEPGKRMAVLSQNHFAFEEYQILDTVIMGHQEMYRIQQEKDAIYMNMEATAAEGMRAAELENKFGEMGGWNAQSDAAELLSNMGISEDLHYLKMADLNGSQKVKVLLAQALFGNPDILILDEPTNDLDANTITWLSNFLADFKNMVIVVSHDRYFLDMVCTHIADIDFQKINIYTGNYTFWYESSKLKAAQIANKNKKTEVKRKEMMEFIQRFSANASKSKQATSRKKALEKLNLEDIQPSSRRYPYIFFEPERQPGTQILQVTKLSKKDEAGNYYFKDVSFTINQGEKIALLARNSAAITTFYEVLAGKLEADSGVIEYGQTITKAYVPNENEEHFSGNQDLDLMDWLRQYSDDKDEQFVRSFLGRMLFSGEEVYKKSSVLSGGEKVRCMMAKTMLSHPNFLLLDEPTNHLDLESITALNEAMVNFKGNMIFSSHDHQLTQTAANRIIELTPKGIIDSLMSYEDYLESDNIQEQRAALLGDALMA
jgi:ATPase subunit of ABC transporter with duplicated ATPase domains